MNKWIATAVGFILATCLGMSITGAQSALVTDYANYPDTPEAQLPEGCDSGGLWHSEVFSLNDQGSESDPSNLPAFNVGDKLTMTWDGHTPSCNGAPVVLSLKVSTTPTFDYSKDQFAYVPYAITYLSDDPTEGGSLSYILPSLARDDFPKGCNYQLDAIVGIPLKVVGPGGSDYSEGYRSNGHSRTTVIKWRNGSYEVCELPTTTAPTTTTEAPTTTTSTTAPSTTTSQPESTTEAPESTVAPTAPAVPVPDVAMAPVEPIASSTEKLPNTGVSPYGLLIAFAILVALGSAAMALGRHLPNRDN